MDTLFRLLPGPQPVWVRYPLTLLIVSAAFALRLSMGEGTGKFGFIHFILPIVASSLLFNRGTGYFAVGVSAALVASILPWAGQVEANLAAIAFFVFVSSCLVLIAEGLHQALGSAHAAQRQSEMLLQEMSHRVKNKFAMIESIIALQSRGSELEARQALEDVASRVKVIGTVHNYLQLSRQEGAIDMAPYLSGLCQALSDALCGPRPITLKTSFNHIQLPPERALPVGLIVNELVTNAFKYAFDDNQSGQIFIGLSEQPDGYRLVVTDNGRGFATNRSPGLGTRLVTAFAGQLGGSAAWAGDEGGCTATIWFPLQPLSVV